jgi:hypothetical protein
MIAAAKRANPARPAASERVVYTIRVGHSTASWFGFALIAQVTRNDLTHWFGFPPVYVPAGFLPCSPRLFAFRCER